MGFFEQLSPTHVVDVGASSTYSYLLDQSKVFIQCLRNVNMLIHAWFYIFILYVIAWMHLYLMGSKHRHVTRSDIVVARVHIQSDQQQFG